MALPPLADLDALKARLTAAEQESLEDARATAALEDASTDVREESRQDWVDELGNITAPDVLVRITLAAALREVRNPGQLASETESRGPFSRTRTFASGTTTTSLTPEEIEVVQRYRPHSKPPLWTLRTTREHHRGLVDTCWVDDQFGTEPFPLYANPWWGAGDCF